MNSINTALDAIYSHRCLIRLYHSFVLMIETMEGVEEALSSSGEREKRKEGKKKEGG